MEQQTRIVTGKQSAHLTKNDQGFILSLGNDDIVHTFTFTLPKVMVDAFILQSAVEWYEKGSITTFLQLAQTIWFPVHETSLAEGRQGKDTYTVLFFIVLPQQADGRVTWEATIFVNGQEQETYSFTVKPEDIKEFVEILAPTVQFSKHEKNTMLWLVRSGAGYWFEVQTPPWLPLKQQLELAIASYNDGDMQNFFLQTNVISLVVNSTNLHDLNQSVKPTHQITTLLYYEAVKQSVGVTLRVFYNEVGQSLVEAETFTFPLSLEAAVELITMLLAQP